MDPQDSTQISQEPMTTEETKPTEPTIHTEVEQKESTQPPADSGTEILKQGAVKAMIWEDIVAKGYDTMDFAQFLGEYQKGNSIYYLLYLI